MTTTEQKRSLTHPDHECPVDGCRQRFLTADSAGRHLDLAHDEAGRWTSDRYAAVDDVGPHGESVVIYDKCNGDAWIQSSVSVEVGER